MIKKFIPTAVGIALFTGVGLANAASKPIELSPAKMDSVTAGGLLNVAPQTNVGPQANVNLLGFGVHQSNRQSNSSGGSPHGGHSGNHGGHNAGYDGGHSGGNHGGNNNWCRNDKNGGHGNHGGNQHGGHGGGNAHVVSFAPQTNVGPQANVNVLGFGVAQSNTQSNRN